MSESSSLQSGSASSHDTTAMDTWLNKAAITWNGDMAHTAPSLYWDPNLLSLLGDCSISYESLVLISAHAVRLLRGDLCKCTSTCFNEFQEIGLPIAVAIPEGPLLPLAVLAVHVLNEPFQHKHAVLVPMDPSEAKERLRHMMKDTRPVLCLVSGPRDAKRLESLVDEAAGIAFAKDGRMCRPNLNAKTKIVDFSEMIKEVFAQSQVTDPLIMIRIRNHLTTMTSSSKESMARLILDCTHLLQSEAVDNGIMSPSPKNRISHIVYTSGTTGVPKGCVSSIHALRHYLMAKNEAHFISSKSVVLLASSLSFDPCLSDILATLEVRATLALSPRKFLVENLYKVLESLQVTHVLCTTTLWSMLSVRPADLPSLQVVALGGEPITNRIVHMWARRNEEGPRLLATYGVTEACVYQTCGEVFNTSETKHSIGQDVGIPLRGSAVQICKQDGTNGAEELSHHDVGEIVLLGQQLDAFSSYLHQPELSRAKFLLQTLRGKPQYTYRTGDRGYIDKETNRLHIIGRIDGEEGMVKINGVRVELGEIESALVDSSDNHASLVTNCLATAQSAEPDGNGPRQIYAYIVLSHACLREMNIVEFSADGILCTSGPLLTLLRARCVARVRPGCLPASFVIIPRLPLSPTGKCDRRKLPPLSQCVAPQSLQQGSKSVPLWEYGKSGKVVAEHIIDCLNLQPCQYAILTSSSSFGMLGGDSLAATLVVRSLYAYHYNVINSRHLGGSYGVLDGPFAAVHLLRSETMGDYVDWLDQHGVCQQRIEDNKTGGSKEGNGHADNQTATSRPMPDGEQECQQDVRLYKALLEAATLGHSVVAMALLDIGVDPNLGNHGGRLAKVSHRHDRKRDFKSNPLHVACSRGDVELTKMLLEKECRFNLPDASSTFPMHLACSRMVAVHEDSPLNGTKDCVTSKDEDTRRMECVNLLLEAGAPLSMKNGNKQTVLHCAARSGHCSLLEFLMQKWRKAGNEGTIQACKQPNKGGLLDWPDRWYRTPVHWAVLNGQVEALRILINYGCSADPPKPKASNRRTSLETESPLEICIRLYGETEGIGKEMSQLLRQGKCSNQEI